MTSFSVSEFNAAHALLDLQTNVRVTNENGEKQSEEVAEQAKLFFSCVITSNVKTSTDNSIPIPKVGKVLPLAVVPKTSVSTPSVESSTSTPVPKRKSPDQELPRDPQIKTYHEEHTSKRSKLFKRKPIKYSPLLLSPETDKEKVKTDAKSSNEASGSGTKKSKPKTRDVGTQTEDLPELPKETYLETMESTISKLCDKIKTLEAQIQTINEDISDDSDNDDDDETNEPTSYVSRRSSHNVEDDENSKDKNKKRVKNKAGPSRAGVKSSTGQSRVLTNRNTNNTSNDLVPIGNGSARVPARIFRYINWNSYTSATRKLLTAVFSRTVLATHCLTGKRSPAFPLKPKKKRLDANLVNDIIQTVVERCRVPESVVRTSITTKCADESKMMRTRLKGKKKQKYKDNKENIPSDTESDSE